MASISKVKIANMSLSHIGAKSSIQSLTENSAAAKIANLWYDYARLLTLESFDWSFARKRLTLAEHSDDPPDGVWGYRYQYPADCIRARSIVNPSGDTADAIPFQIENSLDGTNKTILSDLEDAVLVYTWDLEQTDLFSSLFVKTFSYALAREIAFSMTGKLALQQEMDKQFYINLLHATAQNANEGMQSPPREADWIRGRS